MMDEYSLPAQLPALLLPWYREHRRCCPGGRNGQPYHVWVSEIMLQQTRVEAVKGYYARFLAELPAIQDLAQCDDEKLHKLWEGLGYYSRVRNLKKAAGEIMTRYGGTFPRDYKAVLRFRASGNIPPEPSAPSASISPPRRWTAMCCGCAPGSPMTGLPSTCRTPKKRCGRRWRPFTRPAPEISPRH